MAERQKHVFYRDDLRAILEELKRVATVVKPAVAVFQIKDPDDEVYLTTAATGSAVLVTGNRRDFTEARYGSAEGLSEAACAWLEPVEGEG